MKKIDNTRSLVENAVHLTLDLWDVILENKDYDCWTGDDAIEIITDLAVEFEDYYYSHQDDGTMLELLRQFEKEFLEKRKNLMKEMKSCDLWLDKIETTADRHGTPMFEFNHIECDGTDDGSYIAKEAEPMDENADIMFFDELSVYNLEQIKNIINEHLKS